MTTYKDLNFGESKADAVRRLFREGNREEALAIARTFKKGIAERDQKTLKRGHECLTKPDFYRSLGYDPDQEIAKAFIICSTL